MYALFLTPGAQNPTEMARFRPSKGKTESVCATAPKFSQIYPLELFGLIDKRPGHNSFFAENLFAPTDEFVFTGLVGQSCHFDEAAYAEARRLENPSFIVLKDSIFLD